MEEQDYYFTFGFSHAHPKGFVKIHGTVNSTRDEMFRRFGDKWAFQYNVKDFGDQAERFNLTEIK